MSLKSSMGREGTSVRYWLIHRTRRKGTHPEVTHNCLHLLRLRLRKPIVSYIRVSTGKQGKSGLGIEAQREAIARFAAAGGLEVLTEFVEVETGKGSDALDRRPRLAEALAKAKRAKV